MVSQPAPKAARAATPAEPSPLLIAALEYAARGWKVCPLTWVLPNGACSCTLTRNPQQHKVDAEYPYGKGAAKHPYSILTPHGLSEATTDPDVIRNWWTRAPHANIALVSGRDSGFLVIDIDKEAGEDSFHTLQQRLGVLPPGPIAMSGNGRHYYFAYPTDASVNLRPTISKVAPHIDTRANDSYIIAPPSIHASGAAYYWDDVTADLPLQQLPESWLVALIDANASPNSAARVINAVPGTIPDGTRNGTLTSLVGTMHRRGFHPLAISAAAHLENELCCVPPMLDSEVDVIVWSICKKPTEGVVPIASDDPRIAGLNTTPRVWTIADLIREAPTPPPSIIGEGLLYPGGFALLAGQPGLGKSWLALDMALALSAGQPWLAHPGLPCATPQRVGLISMEMPPHILAARSIKLLDTTRPECKALFEHHGGASPVFLSSPPVATVSLSDSDAGLAYLMDLVDQHQIQVLILDPFSRFHWSDENDTRAIGDVLARIDRLRHGLNCAVVLIHHTRKKSGGPGGASDEEMSSVRGSGRLLSDPQTVWLITKKDKKTSLELVKSNFSAPMDGIILSHQDGGGFLPGDGPTPPDSFVRNNILNALYHAGPAGLVYKTLADIDNVPRKRETFRGFLKSLEDTGDLAKVEGRGNIPAMYFHRDFAPHGWH